MTISEQTFVDAFSCALDATKNKVFWVQDQCSKTHSIQSYLYAELENQLNRPIENEKDKLQLVAEFHKMDAAYINRETLEAASTKNAYPLFGSYSADVVIETENDWKSIEHELTKLFTHQIGLLVIITYCETVESVQKLATDYIGDRGSKKARLLLITKTTEPKDMPERYTDGWVYCKLNGNDWDILNPS